MLRIVLVSIVTMFTMSNVFAANLEKNLKGVFSCGMGADATCEIESDSTSFSFPVNSGVAKKIFSVCTFDEQCCINAVVDQYNNIVSVKSAKKCDESDAASVDSNGNAQSTSSIFQGFRGYKWSENVDLKEKNIELMFQSKDKSETSFKKLDDNLTLGDVDLTQINYYLNNGKFFGVQLFWADNADYGVGKIVAQMVADQVGGFEPIPTPNGGFYFEKNGLRFQFYINLMSKNPLLYINNLHIFVTNNSKQKGTF